ncbi:hypothetical protein FDP25_03380 [Roseovarius sp. A21]|uniref:Uncharacterized protein n=1 Tax=Roseovarius bejariae TaxID=2576383 RepID=A0A844D005_9RHOB|nr:DUF6476 family protein [Roseovarius bejariae]MRU14468.1 hypothetical protein [Roseovarius bejariae]
MSDSPEPQPIDDGLLRFLKLLVTVLTGVMIVGVVVVIFLLVTRFTAEAPALPDEIALPDGAKATAFTQGDQWFAIVTNDNRILLYDRVTGQLKQTITIE